LTWRPSTESESTIASTSARPTLTPTGSLASSSSAASRSCWSPVDRLNQRRRASTGFDCLLKPAQPRLGLGRPPTDIRNPTRVSIHLSGNAEHRAHGGLPLSWREDVADVTVDRIKDGHFRRYTFFGFSAKTGEPGTSVRAAQRW
jgi:hypothetical protein